MSKLLSGRHHPQESCERHSRSRAGGIWALRLELERIDLSELIGDIALHAQDWAGKVGLTLEVECQPGTGKFLADARRLRQVIFNLLSNAFKYTRAAAPSASSPPSWARMYRSQWPTTAPAWHRK